MVCFSKGRWVSMPGVLDRLQVEAEYPAVTFRKLSRAEFLQRRKSKPIRVNAATKELQEIGILDENGNLAAEYRKQ